MFRGWFYCSIFFFFAVSLEAIVGFTHLKQTVIVWLAVKMSRLKSLCGERFCLHRTQTHVISCVGSFFSHGIVGRLQPGFPIIMVALKMMAACWLGS